MATVPKGKAIALVRKRIVPVSQADPYLKVLLYGRNGMGKTRFACTAPKPLLIDIQEKGTKSVRNYKDVEVFPAKSWKEVVWAYWFLRAGGHDYESVILDTITGMQNVCMVQVLKESEDRDPTKDPKTASQRDWGKLAQLMKEQLLNFRNLDMHVIFTAQERTYDNEEEERMERVPDLSPGSRATATACVDIIGRIYKKERRTAVKGGKERVKWETRVLFGPHDDFATKDQTGVLKRIEVEPTIPDILERMNGNSTQEEVKPRRRRRSTRSAEEEDVKQWDVEK
jgi:phage nucleotide-binding protein